MGYPVAAAAGAVMWGGYGVSVHTFGWVRGTLCFAVAAAVAVVIFGFRLHRAEAKRRIDEYVDQVIADDRAIAEMELDWDSSGNP